LKVGNPSYATGVSVGETDGRDDGFVVGDGVLFPGKYVGSNVGSFDGKTDGDEEGYGVGALGV